MFEIPNTKLLVGSAEARTGPQVEFGLVMRMICS
jgi:hypothetical protein